MQYGLKRRWKLAKEGMEIENCLERNRPSEERALTRGGREAGKQPCCCTLILAPGSLRIPQLGQHFWLGVKRGIISTVY
jgi:hypothetical protein